MVRRKTQRAKVNYFFPKRNCQVFKILEVQVAHNRGRQHLVIQVMDLTRRSRTTAGIIAEDWGGW